VEERGEEGSSYHSEWQCRSVENQLTSTADSLSCVALATLQSLLAAAIEASNL
jgi:hypothetical protein